MSVMIPTGILGTAQNLLYNVTLVGASGIAVTNTNGSYSVSYDGTATVSPGTILQSYTFNVTTSFTPTATFSSAYNSSAKFGSIAITTLSNNSQIQIESNLQVLLFPTSYSVSIAYWINAFGAPIGGGVFSIPQANTAYGMIGGYVLHNNSTINDTIGFDACAFISPSTSSTGSNLSRIIGVTDGYSYASTIISQFTISEAQL